MRFPKEAAVLKHDDGGKVLWRMGVIRRAGSGKEGNVLYQFANCELRPVERQLLMDGNPVAMGSRAFDVLLTLVERAGTVVTRNELLDAAWPGLIVEDGNLSVQMSTLRRILGPQAVTTIPGLGYRFSAVLGQDQPAPPEARAPALVPRGGNVPPQQPALFGRERDLSEVVALHHRHRLVTISGTGGIGKTRLAHAVALQTAQRHAAGAWIIELAPVTDPAQLIPAITQALGLRLPALRAPLDELIDALADDDRLLVLDNCEHLVEPVSLLTQALMAHTSRLHLLITSQELLKLSEEHVYRLPPLAVPELDDRDIRDNGAVQLLVARVQALDPRFALHSDNLGDAAAVCRQLDGLPLAIELAAARVPLLGLAGVRQRLGDRLQLLSGGSRSGLRRHRTLRETLAWSHGLLSDTERAAFRRAGVFAGNFALLQAQQVLTGVDEDEWATLDLLANLVDKSLVVLERTDPPRYRLLESTRAYAQEMLSAAGEAAAIRQRHAQAYGALFTASLGLEWKMPSQHRRDAYLPDLDNGRAALDWAMHADPALYVDLSAAVAWLFSAAGHGQEGLRHCQRALADAYTSPLAEARLLLAHAMLDQGSSGQERFAATERAVQLLREVGDQAAVYAALGRLAIAAALCNHGPRGDQATTEMARLCNPAWPPLARWDLLNARDYVANQQRRHIEAKDLADQQLALARHCGDTAKTLFALLATEQCTAALGHYEDAVALGRELIALARQTNHVENLHVYINNLATALAMCGRVDEALPLARQSAARDTRCGSLWKGLELMTLIALRRGRLTEAARILGRSDAVNAHREGDREPVEANVYDVVIVELSVALSADALQIWRAQGALLSDEAATALALDEDVATASTDA